MKHEYFEEHLGPGTCISYNLELRLCHSLVLFIVMVKSLFRGYVLYSPTGSNEREKEEGTYMMFGDFLEECEGTYHKSYLNTSLQCITGFS